MATANTLDGLSSDDANGRRERPPLFPSVRGFICKGVSLLGKLIGDMVLRVESYGIYKASPFATLLLTLRPGHEARPLMTRTSQTLSSRRQRYSQRTQTEHCTIRGHSRTSSHLAHRTISIYVKSDFRCDRLAGRAHYHGVVRTRR
jgi:hypothetical protein